MDQVARNAQSFSTHDDNARDYRYQPVITMLSRCLWNVNADRALVVRTLKVAYFVLVTCTERGDRHRTNMRVSISNQSSVQLSSLLLRLVATWKSWLADRHEYIVFDARHSWDYARAHRSHARYISRSRVGCVAACNVISGFLSQAKSFSSFLLLSFSFLDGVCSLASCSLFIASSLCDDSEFATR